MGESTVDPKDLHHLLDAIVSVGSELSLPVVLRRIVETATELVDANYGALGVLDETGTYLTEFLYTGIDEATAARIGDLPSGRGILGRLIVDPRPLRLDDLGSHPDSFGFPEHHPPMTSFLGVPIRVRGQVFGNLYLTGKRGAGSFTAADEELAIGLATTAGMAIENARLHSLVGELHVVEDRERIARDLHDTVIQRMFAIGLSLQGLAARAHDAEESERLHQAIDDLDETVRHIRSTVFELQRPRIPGRSLRQEVLDLIDECTISTDLTTEVTFDGPLDLTVPDALADHLVAVIREAVTNAVRHANGRRISVSIAANDELSARITDDGVGLVDGSATSVDGGNGLHNLRRRAADLGGTCVIGSNGTGTEVEWIVPLH